MIVIAIATATDNRIDAPPHTLLPGIRLWVCLILAGSFAPLRADPGIPLDEDAVRLYRTRAEQRDAGLQHQLGSWLTASGLAEFEWDAERISFSPQQPRHWDRENVATVQLGLTATPWKALTGELVLEYETDTDRLRAEEATLGFEFASMELQAGRQYSPFGVFFNHFASEALVEFAETRDTGVSLSYNFDERVEVTLMAYRGGARDADERDSGLDWTLAMETAFSDSLSFGVSYQSDLADADSRLLADADDRYQRKVAGIGGFLLWTSRYFEITAEALGAVRAFREFESDSNQPRAWNLEFAHSLHPDLDWALRVEGSHELEDAAALRYGAALNFRLGKQASLTLDYLRSRYRKDFVSDDNDNAFTHADQFAARLSVAF